MGYSSWLQEWNDIIRHVFFADEELKKLMLIPAGTTIIQFIDKYFIRAGYTSEILTDEPVRIIYGNLTESMTKNTHVSVNAITFDVFVRKDQLHNVGDDRLLYRTDLITDRIKQLLLTSPTHHVKIKDREVDPDNYYDSAYRFYFAGEADLGSSVIGYNRRNVSFTYKKT